MTRGRGPRRLPGPALAALLLLGTGSAEAKLRDIVLEVLGSWRSGHGPGGAETVAWDAGGRRLYVTAPGANVLQVLDLSDPARPALESQIDLSSYGETVTCVAAYDGRIAATVESGAEPGALVLLSPRGRLLQRWPVGAGPGALAFSPDGRWLVVANEGEPAADWSLDPEGSITVVDVRTSVQVAEARTVSLELDEEQRAGLLFVDPDAVARHLEPESVAFAPDSRTAWVSLQENDALLEIDLAAAEVARVLPLGYRDPGARDSGFDPSDEDGVIQLSPWPVRSLYKPDGIATLRLGGRTLLLTANEGDPRPGATARVAELTLDPEAFPDAAILQRPERLGRLHVSTAGADEDADGDIDALYAIGARSISVWSPDGGPPLWDSGYEIEAAIARAYPAHFNCDNDTRDCFDRRSDDQGPEPEGLVVAEIENRWFAFVGLERMGGVVVFEIEKARRGRFVQYVNPRDFAADPATTDSGPEGLAFVPADESPIDDPLLVAANEISGTVTIYRVRRLTR